MTRLHAILAALAVVCLARPAVALQTNYQVLGPTPSSYAPLAGGTPLSFIGGGLGNADDEGVASVALPSWLNFRFYGAPVSTAYVGTNGWITFSSTEASNCSTNYSCYLSPSQLPVADPNTSLFVWWADLVQSTVSAGPELVNGTQVFTIDFENAYYYSSSSTTFSVKVRLYPAGSKIEVVYGSIANAAAVTYSDALAGIENDTQTLFANGLPCSGSASLCAASNFPQNTSITYLYEDKADLSWTSAQLTAVSAGPNVGDPVTVTVDGTTANNGTQDAGPFATALYLSPFPDLGDAGLLLDTQPVPNGLPIGGSAPVTFNGSFSRPATGKYYLVLQTDSANQVNEIDEGNNLSPLTVYMGTDLTGSISAPTAGDVGAQVPVTVSIINQGVDAVSGSFDYKIYMSADATLDPSDMLAYTGTLTAADLPYSATQNITIPSNVPAQDFYFILSIDPPSQGAPHGAVAEADETNNIAVAAHPTHAQLPDLAITSVKVLSTASPNPPVSLAFFGEDVLVRVTVANQGQATAHDFDVGLYLSGGLGAAVITTHDQLLADPTFTTLPPGASLTFDTVITVPVQDTTKNPPVNWAEGDFYFGAIADSWAVIGESSETNNIGKLGPLHVRSPAPDFAPVELDVPGQAAVGEAVTVFRVIRNVGNRGNDGSSDTACPYRYYLSANPTITTEDIPLAIVVNGQPTQQGTVKLAIGADDRKTELLQLPNDVPPGTYYLGLLVNPDANVDEVDLTNDWIDGSTQVVVAPPALRITTPWLPDAVVGVGYSIQLGATGGSSYTWALDPSSMLPEGLSLSADGLLSGLPSAPGVSTFVVSVSSNGFTARASLTLVANEVSGPLQVLTANLPSAVANQSYSHFLVGVGGVHPYKWSVVGGALPAGMTLAPDGKVTGVPSVQGGAPATFAVMVTDATGAAATGTVMLRVVSPGSLLISTDALPGGIVGENYPPAGGDNTILAVNGSTPYTFEITAGALPPGLTLVAEPDRVQLDGRPSQPGLYPFTIRVTDANGQQDVHDFAVSVEPEMLSLTAVDLPTVKPGDAYDADLSGADARATWAVYSGALPAGISLDPSGHLGGTCDAKAVAGNYAFIVQAVDRNGRKGLLAENITVLVTNKREVPQKSGCGSVGGATLFAFLPLLGLLMRRRRFAGLAAVALCALPGLARADYSKTSSTISYTTIAGGNPLVSGHASAVNLQLPFSFRFFGQVYGSASVGTSGYLAFGGTANSATPSFSSGTPVIAPWGDNLQLSSTGASVTYVINGVAPNRDVVIQWANADDYNELSASNVHTQFNFRVHLHEDGSIDFEYGTQNPGGTQTRAIAGLSDGANQTVVALSCAGNFGQCTQSDWPTNTLISFVAGTDLAVQNLGTPGLAYQNATANIVATVANVGGQPVASTSVRFVLSTDTTLGNADDQVLGDVAITNFTPGSVKSITWPFDPSSLAPGSYFFFATVDPSNAIVEDSETNNTYGPARLDVAAPAPDLTVANVAAATHTAAPGDAVSVSFTIRNAGTTQSPAAPWSVYLSSNSVISQADMLLASGSTGLLNGGAVSNQSASITLPSSLAPGSYYVGVIVNPQLALAETNALNDIGYDTSPVKVVVGSLSVNTPVNGQLPSTSVGAVYRYGFTAAGGDGHYTWTASSALPPGLSLAADGTLSGRANAAQTAPYSFGISVNDGSGQSASAQFQIQISDASIPLAILTQDLVDAEYAQPFQQSLVAVGGQAPYAWSLSSGTLPDGLVLGADGTLEGLPHTSGLFTFSVQVTDSAATPHTASAALRLNVSGASLRLRAATPTLPDATLDVPYNILLSVTGGFPPYNWRFPYCPDPAPEKCKPVLRFPALPTDGPPQEVGLPHGLYFGCDTLGNAFLTSAPPNIPFGQDGGTPCYNPGLPADAPDVPKEAGLYAIPALVTDSANQQLEVVYTLRIGFGQGLVITSAAAPDALRGQAYGFKLQADSPQTVGSIHWQLACAEHDSAGVPLSPCPEPLPPGLSLQDDGTLTGTPTDGTGKTYTFLVRAADEEGRADVRALAITSRDATPVPKKGGCGAAEGGSMLAMLLAPLALLSRRKRALAFAAVAALALLAGCGSKPANTRCTGVTCLGGTACDPADGLCKCGGEGGLLCRAGQLCDAASKACLDATNLCAGVTCTGNTACDPADGQCKCGGPGGAVCGTGQVCQPATRTCTGLSACTGVVCSGRQVCDPADGLCKCDGQLCGAGQICADADGGGCVTSNCAGVHCTGNTTCDEQSGACLCNGSYCGAGQTCACTGDAGSCADASRLCVDSSLCASVTCSGGSTCDPADGQCKCGGPGGPICGANQGCDVTVGACIGGDRCRNVTCATGTSCDPEDGQCKCGGQGGQVCSGNDVCFQLQNGYACRTPCDPLAQDCPPSQACYFDESAGGSAGYCATPGTKTDTGNPPPYCNSANDCAQGFNCDPAAGRNFPGLCHRYCSVPQGATGCTGSDNCVQISNGAPTGLGQCR